MSNYYDPWAHAIQIFFTRLFQFILLTLILGFLVWYAWLHFYFEAAFFSNTKKTIFGDSELIKATFIMCFACSGLFTSLLFSWLMVGRSQKGELHHRGSRMID